MDINYDLSDLNLIGAYIQEGEEYKQTNEIPSSGYEFNSEESLCPDKFCLNFYDIKKGIFLG